MWINKYIAHTGYCSRREADKLVEEGRVVVNGALAHKTLQVFEYDNVKIDGHYITPPRRHRIYIALNKPIGVVVTTETTVEDNILEFVGHEERIFPIGRMDRDSHGLILLTNDGDIVNRFTEPQYGAEKEYYVRTDQKISYELIHNLLEGVEIDGRLVKPVRIKRVAPRALRITVLDESRRLIRRMLAKFDYRVYKLERIRIMHIHVRDIPLGDWRYLTGFEVKKMFNMLNYHPAQKWNDPNREAPRREERRPYVSEKPAPSKDSSDFSFKELDDMWKDL